MAVSAPDIDDAYRFFLGRPPPTGKTVHFRSMQQLFQTIMGSAEFRGRSRSWKSTLPWPQRQIFVAPEARVLYCPIGKNGCSFLKAQMVRLYAPPEAAFILRDVHLLTDHVNTGLQLSDYSDAEAQAYVHAPDFMKFAVLRHPRDRLLSAWMDKFLLNRSDHGNQRHAGPVIAAVQGQARPDYFRSITFDQFVDYVAHAPADELDPHWRPQHLYLQGITYTHLFSFDDLNSVIDALEGWTGVTLPRRPVNATGSSEAGGVDVPGAHQLEPAILDTLPRVSKSCFFDDRLNQLIDATFAQDIELLKMIGPSS